MEIKSSDEMRQYNHLLGEMEATYHECSLKLGISDSVSKILYTICVFGGSDLLSNICRHTGLSKQTVNSAIRKLEKEGIIYLSSVNGKAKKVFLTAEGRIYAEKTAMRIIEMENEIFESWSREELQKYLELTERFLAALKDKTSCL